jgi:hypothetical protein
VAGSIGGLRPPAQPAEGWRYKACLGTINSSDSNSFPVKTSFASQSARMALSSWRRLRISAAGATAIGVTTGPDARDVLIAAGADVVLTSLTEFPAWLEKRANAVR